MSRRLPLLVLAVALVALLAPSAASAKGSFSLGVANGDVSRAARSCGVTPPARAP